MAAYNKFLPATEPMNEAMNAAALLARQDYDRFMQIVAMAIEMQEEEDIEMLLLM